MGKTGLLLVLTETTIHIIKTMTTSHLLILIEGADINVGKLCHIAVVERGIDRESKYIANSNSILL